MFNQLKSEFLKLKYSKLSKAIPILFLAGIVLYGIFSISVGGTQLFVSEGDEETNDAIQGMVGFFAFTFENSNIPKFSEIMQSCMSCNVFLWIIVLILTIQFFCYDYSVGTIKLPVAYGIDRIKVYFAKVIIIVLYSAVCYFLFGVATLCFTCFYTGYAPCIAEIIQFQGYVGLNFLVMVSFILLCLTVSIWLKNIGIITTVLCLFTLGGAVVYTGIWQDFHSHAILKYLIWLNPLYYWMNMGSFRLEYGLVNEIAGYFIFGLLFLLPVSVILVRKQEFK
ncbi:MAG: ABC transporter permease [Lachnospiraceae bacterium]|nr:ABC transporter permease [Lachnospiraceae bacterium]